MFEAVLVFNVESWNFAVNLDGILPCFTQYSCFLMRPFPLFFKDMFERTVVPNWLVHCLKKKKKKKRQSAEPKNKSAIGGLTHLHNLR